MTTEQQQRLFNDLQNLDGRNRKIQQLARQELDERTLLTTRDLPWGRMNASEYFTGIIDPSRLPQSTQEVIKRDHLDPRDFLYSTTTASSVLVNDTARLQYTYNFLDNAQRLSTKPELHVRYLTRVQNHVRGEIADFLQLGKGEQKDRILLDHSGTHSALSLHMLFPDASVIMTTEVGRSLKTAYEGKHPFSSDIHGNPVTKNAYVTNAGKVVEVPIREGENGTPRPEREIRDSFVSTIKSEMERGRKTIILHIPLPPKTGINPKERIEWMRELRDKKKLMKRLGLKNESALPKVIVLGDMAQSRFLYGIRRGNVYDPTSSNRDGGFCDIAMLALSKSIGAMPLSGALVMNRETTDIAKRSVATWRPEYIEHYVSLGQLPDSWRKQGLTNGNLRSFVEGRNIRQKSLVAADALTARLLSAGDVPRNMKRLGFERGQKNFERIKITWENIVSNKKGLAAVYRDVSDRNTPSTFSYQLENVNEREDAYQTAQTIRRMMLTPFTQQSLDAVRNWSLTDKQKDAMRLLFETGFPVSEEATGLPNNGRHKPILRVGMGWLQAIDWSKTNIFNPNKSRRRQIAKALDYLATKLDVLALHVDELDKLEPFTVQVASASLAKSR